MSARVRRLQGLATGLQPPTPVFGLPVKGCDLLLRNCYGLSPRLFRRADEKDRAGLSLPCLPGSSTALTLGRSLINNVKTRQVLDDDLQQVAFNDDVPATESAESSGDMCTRGIVPLPCRGNASARIRHSPG